MSEKITALPWKYDGHEYYNDCGGRFREIVGANEEEVIGEYAYISDMDATFIVRAVNSHDALVEALKRCVTRMTAELPDPQDIDELYFALEVLAKAEKT